MARRLSIALLASGLLLAACGTPEPPRTAHGRWAETYPDWKPGDPLPAAAPTSAATVAPPPPTAPAQPAPARQTALPPRPAPQSPPEPPPEPPKLEELRGLNGGQLTALLGKPTLLRQEPGVQMWQYRGESCVLHLFLYAAAGQPGSGEPRVQHVEARPRQTGARAATTGPSDCLATLVGARRLRS